MRAFPICFILVAFAAGGASAASPDTGTLKGDFDVGGHTIHLSCEGVGSPVVVIKEFLSLSSNSHQNIAATAGHGLPHEAPDFVVENIVQAVTLARSGH